MDNLAPLERELYVYYYRKELEAQKEREQKRDSGVNISGGRSIGALPNLGI